MATGYQGYTGYDDESVRRQRAMADALMQRSQQPRKIEHWTQGAAQLAEALLARQAMDKADASEKSYKTNQQQIADALIGNAFPDAKTASATELAAPVAYDLTPKAAESRAATASLGNQVKLMANLTGNPLQAMQYGQGVLAARQADNRYRDETQYARGRDLVGDQKDDRNFGLQEDQFGFQKGRAGVADEQWKAQFGESKRQFDARMAADAAQAAQAAELKRQEIQSKRDGSAMFEGPQLASVYNKSMDFVDDARKQQGVLDTIASNAQQFVDTAKDKGFWAQGEGFWNDAAQALSMDTTTLKSLTDRIAPLMREAGSGASSDKDVDMFKSAVVSINNTPEANQRFAKGAAALAKRNNEYVQFLNEAIVPQDPQSRQKAQRIWDMYKNDQRLFDDATGVVNPDAKSFTEWFAENSGVGQPVAAAAPAPDDVSDLLEKYR